MFPSNFLPLQKIFTSPCCLHSVNERGLIKKGEMREQANFHQENFSSAKSPVTMNEEQMIRFGLLSGDCLQIMLLLSGER